MLSAISRQLSAPIKSVSARKAESRKLKSESYSQRGMMSPLAMLILVVLGVFIIWELTYIMQGKFNNEKISPIKTAQPLSGCNFPDESDPCDLDSGAGFDL